ncbi:hypothetical protein FNV43_RR14229 [Rhamnella rubrinervis]|uniref:NET domain-containing protein n=1 Tax=Rhamnella rubrinervis TaxID=2594499 RepID=A0A8K0H2K2_9ROSA|nr:hypothetical protein FNV43_RR14229 [Rhamnella rubrinervis]
MSEDSRGLAVSPVHNKLGPDYFGYYKREVVELLSEDEDLLRHSNTEFGSLFSNGIQSGLSDLKRERLKTLLRQGLKVLAPEVEEMLDPVTSMHQLQSQLRSRRCFPRSTGATSEIDVRQSPSKKAKVSSSSSSTSLPALGSPTDNGLNVVTNGFWDYTETTKCTARPEEPQVDDDLKFLLENDDSVRVEETVKNYSDELCATLGHMEQQLEELLDTVMSKCRPMTPAEKRKLRKLIQVLPPKHLDHVVEIIQRSKPAETKSCDEIHVELEKENNVTLWRLYYYVEAIERTKELSR